MAKPARHPQHVAESLIHTRCICNAGSKGSYLVHLPSYKEQLTQSWVAGVILPTLLQQMAPAHRATESALVECCTCNSNRASCSNRACNPLEQLQSSPSARAGCCMGCTALVTLFDRPKLALQVGNACLSCNLQKLQTCLAAANLAATSSLPCRGATRKA